MNTKFNALSPFDSPQVLSFGSFTALHNASNTMRLNKHSFSTNFHSFKRFWLLKIVNSFPFISNVNELSENRWYQWRQYACGRFPSPVRHQQSIPSNYYFYLSLQDANNRMFVRVYWISILTLNKHDYLIVHISTCTYCDCTWH